MVPLLQQVTMLLIIILHIVYYQKMQQPTKLFVNLCISIFLFQVSHINVVLSITTIHFQTIALVNMLITDSTSQTGCTVLSILTQLTVIAQFAWIAALVSKKTTLFTQKMELILSP